MAESKIDTWNQALSRIGETKFLLSENDTSIPAKVCRLYWDRTLKEVFEKHRWQFASTEASLSRIDEQTVTYDANSTPDTDNSETKFPITFAFVTADLLVELAGVTQTIGSSNDYTVTDNQEDAGSSFVQMVVAPGVGVILKLTMSFERQGWDYLYSLPSDLVRVTAVIFNGIRHDAVAEANRSQFAVLPRPDKKSMMLASNQGTAGVMLEYIALIDHVPAWPALFHDVVIWRLAAELAMPLKKSAAERARCMQGYAYALSQARAADSNQKQSRRAQTPSLQARGLGDYQNDYPPFRGPDRT